MNGLQLYYDYHNTYMLNVSYCKIQAECLFYIFPGVI